MGWRYALALSFVAGPAACLDAAKSAPAMPALHLVRGDELVATLTDVRMYLGDSGNPTAPTSTRLVEQFYADGVYARHGGWVTQFGSFSFNGDKSCAPVGEKNGVVLLFGTKAMGNA